MSTGSSENTNSGRPTEVPQKGDRYLFGNLESFAKNQEKLREVNWGYDQPEGIVLASLDSALNWVRKNSVWPMTFGLACCAIEMMSIVGARLDIARFGFEAFRASPRQADLIILSGRVSIKMAPVIRRIWDQMLEPKWAISMGACCSSMGVFNNYALVPSDKFMPIEVHVPGCPPRPEALMHGILKLRDKIQGHPVEGWRERYAAVGTEELLPGGADLTSANVNVFKPGDTAGA